jgi:multidrug efflux pump subunit AcrA (membrane-fusion protein)
MKKSWLLLLVPALLVLWWVLSRQQSATAVHFSTARTLTIESTVPTNGKIEPAQWAAARAETAGVVRRIEIERGQKVEAGQTLVDLDVAAAQSELASALANEQQARVDISAINQGGKTGALAEINDKIASAEAAVTVAQRTLTSTEHLEAQQAATKLQVQDAKDALDRAKLQLDSYRNQKRTLVTSSDKTVAEAKLHDAEAAVSLANHKLSLGRIRAPIAGTVYQFDLKVGAYLQPGTLVALIGDLDQVKVSVYVDEPDLGRVSLNDPVSITWDARPGQRWWGRVDKLPTEIISLEARKVGEVSTVVTNPNHELLPGVTVNATIISQVVKDALSIPKAALHMIGGRQGVYKLTGRRITWTQVQTGVSDINNVQIVSGLRAGDYVADRVVEPSDAEIRNGMTVKPLLH